jgi:hypothetical protein
MLRRRQGKRNKINADPGESLLRRVGERLHGGADAVRWPLERVAWALEERLLWPLQERAAALPAPGRATGAAALAVVAALAVAVGVLALTGEDSAEERPAPVAVAPLASPAPVPPPEANDEPALEGVAPSFGSGGVAAGNDPGGAGAGAGADAAAADDQTSDEVADAVPTTDEETAAATSSREKPVPAGPAAMKVARRFSEAFVLYEIGERPARAMAVFAETATPRLATALAERPPRQPAGTEVPKARVLNLVPGPRHGKAYTVSASLLRVGVTSELRLQMKNQAGNWVVTDVRG